MRFSGENSIRRNQYAVFRRKQHKKKPVCGFQKKTAYEEISMRFSEENSIRRNQYAVFKRKQHKKKSACGFHEKTA